MAYPGEHEHLEYLKYREAFALGEAEGVNGRAMTKEEWRKWRKQSNLQAQAKTGGRLQNLRP